MRISDILLSNNYMNGLSSIKNKISDLNTKIITQQKINKPSDSPTGTSRILNMYKKISQSDTYTNNINNSLAFINETTFALESVQSEITKILTSLTEIENPANNQNLDSYADQIDNSLQSILNYANSKYDGKFLFGGTDFSSEPFGFTADESSIEVKVNDISGEQKVKFSQNIIQKINTTGREVFGTIISQSGNIDSGSIVGDVISNQVSIYDADGNQYSLNVNYTKTGANSYSLTYDILDSSSASIFGAPPAAKSVGFNSTTGKIESVNGENDFSFDIKVPASKIDISLDLSLLKESSSASSITLSANQQNDVFNTIIQIRDNLRTGIKPTTEQNEMLKNFNQRVLEKISDNGNVVNQLNDAAELIANQKIGIEELLSKEQDVDIAKAITDLQHQDYVLQMNYKLAAMYLPKSLLDYL